MTQATLPFRPSIPPRYGAAVTTGGAAGVPARQLSALRLSVVLALAVMSGIGNGACSGLKLRLVDASVRKPSNVAVYFTVDTTSNQPVADLQATDFQVYEDGKPVSELESKQTILQQEIAAVHYTLLLVDMSGSVVGSGDMPALMSAASSFAERVGPYQKVALYTFDGSPHINAVVPFGGNVRGGVAALGRYHPRDPSTNLNGGVVDAVKVLARQMEGATQPLRFGTLVVFTDGTDRAHRVSADQVRTTLDSAAFDTFAIGVGAEVDKSELTAIGRSGTFASQNREDIARGFDEVAARIEAASKRFYLLSYCSPSRAGEHDVEIEAVSKGKRGRLKHHFNASGFGPNCDPNQKPAFDVRHPKFRYADADGKHSGRAETGGNPTFSRPANGHRNSSGHRSGNGDVAGNNQGGGSTGFHPSR